MGIGLGTVPLHVIMLRCIPQVGITGGGVRLIEIVFHAGQGQALVQDRSERIQARKTIRDTRVVAAIGVADAVKVLLQQVLQCQEFLLRGPALIQAPAQPGTACHCL